MKIDRVLLSSNSNINYYPYWNPLSKVYREKFGVIPTLIWVGTEQEKNDCGISTEYGDVVVVEPNPKYPTSSQCTWSTYWSTHLFPNDTCFICGIDEVPLSGMFMKDMIAEYSDNSYVMLIADAYTPDHWSIAGGTSPSGQHVAKGSTFMRIYEFENDFKDEIDKVYSSGSLETYLIRNPQGYQSDHFKWGTDETYFSHKLRSYIGDEIISLNNFNLMRDRRIECYRSYETPYDLVKLKDGWYSQVHLCRPFIDHKDYILKLYSDIGNYNT